MGFFTMISVQRLIYNVFFTMIFSQWLSFNDFETTVSYNTMIFYNGFSTMIFKQRKKTTIWTWFSTVFIQRFIYNDIPTMILVQWFWYNDLHTTISIQRFWYNDLYTTICIQRFSYNDSYTTIFSARIQRFSLAANDLVVLYENGDHCQKTPKIVVYWFVEWQIVGRRGSPANDFSRIQRFLALLAMIFPVGMYWTFTPKYDSGHEFEHVIAKYKTSFCSNNIIVNY